MFSASSNQMRDRSDSSCGEEENEGHVRFSDEEYESEGDEDEDKSKKGNTAGVDRMLERLKIEATEHSTNLMQEATLHNQKLKQDATAHSDKLIQDATSHSEKLKSTATSSFRIFAEIEVNEHTKTIKAATNDALNEVQNASNIAEDKVKDAGDAMTTTFKNAAGDHARKLKEESIGQIDAATQKSIATFNSNADTYAQSLKSAAISDIDRAKNFAIDTMQNKFEKHMDNRVVNEKIGTLAKDVENIQFDVEEIHVKLKEMKAVYEENENLLDQLMKVQKDVLILLDEHYETPEAWQKHFDKRSKLENEFRGIKDRMNRNALSTQNLNIVGKVDCVFMPSSLVLKLKQRYSLST